jgi:hypothetical protein
MEEKRYRESRLCRLLGNPIIYQLILLLDAGGPERKLKDENGKMNLGQAMKMTAEGERDES